jgi:hypothetical protein
VIRRGSNPFERAARLHKVSRLVEVIDAACRGPKRKARLDPVRDGAELADLLEAWPDECWQRAALVAGVIPKSGKLPSPETRAAVVEFYRERARRAS